MYNSRRNSRHLNEFINIDNLQKKDAERREAVSNIETDDNIDKQKWAEQRADENAILAIRKIFDGSDVIYDEELGSWKLVPADGKNKVALNNKYEEKYDGLSRLGGIEVDCKLEVLDNAINNNNNVKSLFRLISDDNLVFVDDAFVLLDLRAIPLDDDDCVSMIKLLQTKNIPYIAVYGEGGYANCDNLSTNLYDFPDNFQLRMTYIRNMGLCISKFIEERHMSLVDVKYNKNGVTINVDVNSIRYDEIGNLLKKCVSNAAKYIGNRKKYNDMMKKMISVKTRDKVEHVNQLFTESALIRNKNNRRLNEAFAGHDNPLNMLSLFNTRYNYISEVDEKTQPSFEGFKFLVNILGDTGNSEYVLDTNCKIYKNAHFDEIVEMYGSDDTMAALLSDKNDTRKYANSYENLLKYLNHNPEQYGIMLRRLDKSQPGSKKYLRTYGNGKYSREDDTKTLAKIKFTKEDVEDLYNRLKDASVLPVDTKDWYSNYPKKDSEGNVLLDSNGEPIQDEGAYGAARVLNRLVNSDTLTMINTSGSLFRSLYNYESQHGEDFPVIVVCNNAMEIKYVMYNGDINKFGGIHMNSYNVKGWSYKYPKIYEIGLFDAGDTTPRPKDGKYDTLNINELTDYFTIVFGDIDFDAFADSAYSDSGLDTTITSRAQRFHGDNSEDGKWGDFATSKSNELASVDQNSFDMIATKTEDGISCTIQLPSEDGTIPEEIQSFIDENGIKYESISENKGVNVIIKNMILNSDDSYDALYYLIMSTTIYSPFFKGMDDEDFELARKAITFNIDNSDFNEVKEDINTIIGYMKECNIICNYVEEGMSDETGEDYDDEKYAKYFGKTVYTRPGIVKYREEVMKTSTYKNAQECLSEELPRILIAYINELMKAKYGEDKSLGSVSSNYESGYHRLIKRINRKLIREVDDAVSKVKVDEFIKTIKNDPSVKSKLQDIIPEYENHKASEYYGHRENGFDMKRRAVENAEGVKFTKFRDVVKDILGRGLDLQQIQNSITKIKNNSISIVDAASTPDDIRDIANDVIAKCDSIYEELIDGLNDAMDNNDDTRDRYRAMSKVLRKYQDDSDGLTMLYKRLPLRHATKSGRNKGRKAR